MIQTADDLVHETGISNRENSWEIMLNVAKKWKRRVHIFQLLYCSDLDESRWIKFDLETKFKIAKKRAVEKQVINEYCLDGMKIKQNILLCGPYSAPENKEMNICYVKNMRAILEIQGCGNDDLNRLIGVKNDNQHQKFVSSLLKSNKKPTSLIFDLSKKRLDQIENKSIHNNALLRFRTLFYTDKMSLDALKNLLNLQHRKDFSSNPKGCLTFDWNCEKCLMSVIQNTLDIYSHSLKICSCIINRKVDEIHALKQNQESLPEMDDVYDVNEVYESNDILKPSKKDSNFKQVRSSFMIQSALEYYLPSAVLELCFNSDCQHIHNVTPSTEKTHILCKEHENSLNSHIIKCFENTIRFFDKSHYDEDLELMLFEILLGNKNRNVSDICKVKTKTVRFLQQIIELGSKQPKKNKTNKKEDDRSEMKNQPTTPQSSINADPHLKTPNSQDHSRDSQSLEGNSVSNTIVDLVNDDDYLDDSNKFTDPLTSTAPSPTKDSVTQKTSVYAIDDFLKLSKTIFGNDDNFTTKLKEMIHGLSIDSQTDLLILNNKNEESSPTSKRQRDEFIINTDSADAKVTSKKTKVESIDSDANESSPVLESPSSYEKTAPDNDLIKSDNTDLEANQTSHDVQAYKSKVLGKDSGVKNKVSKNKFTRIGRQGKEGFSFKSNSNSTTQTSPESTTTVKGIKSNTASQG